MNRTIGLMLAAMWMSGGATCLSPNNGDGNGREGADLDDDTQSLDGTDADSGGDDDDTDSDSDSGPDWRDDSEQPIAVCFALPGEWYYGDEPIVLDGTASFGIGLNNLTWWDWTVASAPNASVAQPTITGPGLSSFVPDVRGDYELSLVVTDEHDVQSEPCLSTLSVVADPIALECSGPEFATVDIEHTYTATTTGGAGTPTFEWSVVADETGSVELLQTTGEQTNAISEQLGLASIQVVATDALGSVSDPCIVETEFTDFTGPWNTGVTITLTWSHAGEDLDLHVIRDDGSPRTPDDCYFANCQPLQGEPVELDWGILGETGDNPSLIAQDTPGMGPEQVLLTGPVSTPEIWTIMVHDYPGSVRAAATDATVEVAIDGVVIYETTTRITGEDTDTYLFTFNTGTAIVTPIE